MSSSGGCNSKHARHVYGPGDTEVLRAFKAAAMLALASTLGSGEQELSALFAPDLAAALVAADGSDTTGKTYPVCHPKIFTSREMARAVGRPTLLDSAKADELLAPAWTGDPTAFTRDSG
ncbi:MAG: hypothetical protein EP299_13705, partial [Acidobacteria bacterium]